MPYCFADMRASSEGLKPDFPEGTSFLLLFDCQSVDFGLYNYTLDIENEEWFPKNPVSDELKSLIESGIKYPPVLALSKDEFSKIFQNKKPTMEEFSNSIIRILKKYLIKQQELVFIFAQSIRDEIGYLSETEWYWVIGVSKKEPNNVLWVSNDFYIYSNPITDFNLTKEQLSRLTIA